MIGTYTLRRAEAEEVRLVKIIYVHGKRGDEDVRVSQVIVFTSTKSKFG